MEVIEDNTERKQILREYRRLLKNAKPNLEEGGAAQIKKAFHTASEAHQGMRRKSGEPYILHPLAVARICVEEIGLGTVAVIAALLHDTVEDTEIELEDIERDFGARVAKIIDGLTKISEVFEHGSSQQAENFRKMLITLSDDVRVILIKLADRLHNMRTMESMPRDKQLKIASETGYIYAPLAHRLGLYNIKTELEDLYFKYTEPSAYHEIAEKIKQTKAVRSRFINIFIAPIKEELEKQGYTFYIRSRPKSIYSIWQKMKKKNITFEEVYDLFAVRIIVDVPPEKEKAACWHVYSIITDYYKPNPDRLRDWISTPKANGYESLHTTVMSNQGQWVEVQIRSKRMDEIAEKGYAAHWKYKSSYNSDRESGLETWIRKVREMIEQHNSSALDFVNEFRNNLFQEEVFVFTPKGELRILQYGATALDFAFDIHTQVGLHCLGAKVNQKLVPLSHELQNGDQVEILTSKKQIPNEDWLSYVVTSKARSKIKGFLKEQKKEAAQEGEHIVKEEMATLNLELNQDLLNSLMYYFEESNSTDFYFNVAKGFITREELRNFKSNKSRDKKKATEEKDDPLVVEENENGEHVNQGEIEFDIEKLNRLQQKNRDKDMVLRSNGMNNKYTLAKCCNPIPGDEIFAFVTEEGIKIHRVNCPNAVSLLSNYGYQIVKAKWTENQEIAFLTGLYIKGIDRVGMMNEVTKVISDELKVNMRSITVDSKDGIFEGHIMLFVNDTKHLDSLIKNLKEIPDVRSVTRLTE